MYDNVVVVVVVDVACLERKQVSKLANIKIKQPVQVPASNVKIRCHEAMCVCLRLELN